MYGIPASQQRCPGGGTDRLAVVLLHHDSLPGQGVQVRGQHLLGVISISIAIISISLISISIISQVSLVKFPRLGRLVYGPTFCSYDENPDT